MALWKEMMQNDHLQRPEVEQPSPTPATPMPYRKESHSKTRQETFFGVGTTIEGKITGDVDVRIAGKFTGDIEVKGILNIEKGGHLTANVNAGTIIIAGRIEGNTVSNGQVTVLGSGEVIGDLKAKSASVAPGARIRGNVEFGCSEPEVDQVSIIRASEKATNSFSNDEETREL